MTADRGSCLGYVRLVGRRRAEARLKEPIVSISRLYEEALAQSSRFRAMCDRMCH